jgi:FkbM family methyltransferase
MALTCLYIAGHPRNPIPLSYFFMNKFIDKIAKLAPLYLQRNIIRLGLYYKANNNVLHPSFPSQISTFASLRRLGWSPIAAIDIGAYQGEWACMLRQVFPQAKVFMVEAQENKRSCLQEVSKKLSPGANYEIALVGASDGPEILFAQMETGSSVYHETSHVPRVLRSMRLVKLDTLLQRHPAFAQANFLKIDVQGYELEVLKGSPMLCEQLDAIMLEVSLLAVNSGAPSFLDVMIFMNSIGFHIFDFCGEVRRTDGVLWQVDLLFVRKDGPIAAVAELTPGNWIV